MLCLGQGHAIAGHDDHPFGVFEHGRCAGLFALAGCFRLRRVPGACLGLHFILRQLDQMGHGLGGVAQAHVHSRLFVERIFHASIAWLFVKVADDDVFGLVRIQNGHAVDGRALGGIGRRVDHVVGPHDNRQIRLWKERVHRVHFQQMLIVHIGFSQKHVHVPGHPAGNRVNGVIHLGPVGLQRVRQLLDLMLGLGQGHAVAGHDDHPFGGMQQAGKRRILVFGGCWSFGRGLLACAARQLDQTGDGFCGVAQAHVYARLFVERILHASITRLFVKVADDDVFGLVHIQNGHAIDGRALGGIGRRIDHVIGPHDDGQIRLWKERVHRVHFQQMFIVHIGFSQKHVHVPGHPAGNRVNGVIHLGPVGLQRVRQLLDLMLGLGQGHAVAGHDDHPFGPAQEPGEFGIFISSRGLCRRGGRGCRPRRGRGRDRSGRSGGVGRRAGLFAAYRGFAKQDGHEPPVHGLAHDAGEHVASRADDAAHGDEQRVGHGKAGNGAGNAAHGIEQRNGDGHVRAAHAQGEDHAKERAGDEHQADHQPGQELRRNVIDRQGQRHHPQQDVDYPAVIGQHDGPLRQKLVQLSGCHKGACNGGHAGAEGQTSVDAVKGRFRAHVHQHDQAHQGGRAAAEAVEKSHQLRHLDHLDLVGEKKAKAHACGNGDPDIERAERAVLEHGHDNGQGHGPGRNGIAADGGLNLAHEVQAVENGQGQHWGDDVIESAHARSFSLESGNGRKSQAWRFLPAIILSILLVMSKPPKTLVMASAMATPPKNAPSVVSDRCVAVSAPRMMTPSRAFMLDMSGVCKRLGIWLKTL